jgi:hypothetical protein
VNAELRRPHPGWDEMRTFLESGAPSLHVLDGTPRVSIFVDPEAPRIGLRVPLGAAEYAQEAPLAEIDAHVGLVDGEQTLTISTGNASLFPIFFPFALSLADRLQLEHADVGAAVKASLDQWRALLRQAAMLSEDEQTGLMGELWMLERLALRAPAVAIDAWTGPDREAHDFRIGDREFEVKTTRGERRVHVISNMTQLVPSLERSLYILSLQFAASGAVGGSSLAERLEDLRGIFDRHGLATDFDRLLQSGFGLDPSNWHFYRQRLLLRSRPVLIPVTDDLPSIRQGDVSAIPRPGMERVSDVRYRLDLTGLGFEEGSQEFNSLIPAAEETS